LVTAWRCPIESSMTSGVTRHVTAVDPRLKAEVST
jgi:hypothetical protein